jgi:hypothetical protein
MLSRLSVALCLGATLILAACSGGGSAAYPNLPGVPVAVDIFAASAAVARLNVYRAQAGLPPVDLDLDLSRGCQMHANYLDYNRISLTVVGLGAHAQTPNLPGYSSEGAQSARNSIIYQGVGPVEAIDNWMNTFYHRVGLFDPNLLRVGFGSTSEFQVMDVNQGRLFGETAVPSIVLFPGPGMTGLNGEFQEEIPMPVQDPRMGIPITVEFCGPQVLSIRDVEATLTDRLSGAKVPFYLNAPGDPLLAEWDYPNLIALIPREPLAESSVFKVEVSAEVDGNIYTTQWEFATK